MSSIPLHRRIGVRIFGAFFAVAVFSVAVTATTHYLFAGAIMRSNVGQRNLQIARRAAGEIALYIEDALRSIRAVAQVLGPIRDPWTKDIVLEELTTLLAQFGWIHLVDVEGRVIASSELDNSVVVLSPAILRRLAEPGGRYVSEVELTPSNLPVLTVIEPLPEVDRPRRALVARLHLREIWRLVDEIAFGESGKAYLVSSERLLIAHPDKTRVLTVSDTAYLPERAADWRDTVFTGRDPSGVAMLVATAGVGVLGWHLVIEQHLAEAYIPVTTTMIALTAVSLLALSVAIVASFLLARRYTVPLNHLLDGTNRIREGDLSYRIGIDTGDEIGRLSRSFDSMVEDLQKRSKELEQSEEKYRLLTENVNDIIFVSDEKGRIIHINRRASAIFGENGPGIIGASFAELLPAAIRNPRRDGVFEVELAPSPGRRLTLEVKIVMTHDPKQGILYYGVARDITERKATEVRLARYQKQLRSLASQLSLAEARERKRIAAGIHDRIGQALALVRIKLGTLGEATLSSEGADALAETTRLIEEIIQDTRSLIFSISSPLLYEVGLSAALERLVEQFHQEYDLSFIYNGGNRDATLDTDVSVLLFDSVRELMMNVAKHARARSCRVSMSATPDEVILTVSDDGVGMNGSTSDGEPSGCDGYGLFSIRERLDHIGGRMRLSSEPGRGTTVALTVPARKE